MYKKSADFLAQNRTRSILHDKISQFYRTTKSDDFCMMHSRFLSGDFVGR